MFCPFRIIELQIIETEILIESFGIKWRKPGRKIKVRKNKKGKELREMINEDIIGQCHNTAPEVCAGEEKDSITVQGIYPECIVIRRRSSDIPHEMNSPDSYPHATLKGKDHYSSKLG